MQNNQNVSCLIAINTKYRKRLPLRGGERSRTAGSLESCACGQVIGVFEALYEGKDSPGQKDMASTTVACLIGTLMLARCADNDKTAQGYLDATRNTLFRFLPESEAGNILETKD